MNLGVQGPAIRPYSCRGHVKDRVCILPPVFQKNFLVFKIIEQFSSYTQFEMNQIFIQFVHINLVAPFFKVRNSYPYTY